MDAQPWELAGANISRALRQNAMWFLDALVVGSARALGDCRIYANHAIESTKVRELFCLPSILRFLIAVALGLITASGLEALLFANLVICLHGPLLSDCLGIYIEGLGLTVEAGCFGLDC